MSARLTPISISTSGLDPAPNINAVVNDTDQGLLLKSDGSNWLPLFAPGAAGTDSGSAPAPDVPNTVIYDPKYGWLYSDGSSWQVPARDPTEEVGLTRGASSSGQIWPAPRIVSALDGGALTGSSPLVGFLYLTPFTVPTIGPSQPLQDLIYRVSILDAIGAALVGLYTEVSAVNQFPGEIYDSGIVTSETATGLVTASLAGGLGVPANRGTRVWFAYLRTAGAATLETQTQGPGSLGWNVTAGATSATSAPQDWLQSTTTGLTSLPPSLLSHAFRRVVTSALPQFYVGTG